jgi:hypothetical protein
MKNKILSLLILSVFLMMIGSISALHTTAVTVSPSGWLKQSTSYNFAFTVTNNGPDSINDVTIDGDSQFGSLVCGTAPTGWTLYSSLSSYCRYTTNVVANFITSGNNKVFTVTAPTLASFGNKSWLITSRESGESGVQYNNVYSTVQTIQSAIDSASPGDTINVPAGTYVEDLVISSSKTNLNIVGAGSSTTTIKGIVTGTITYPEAFPNIDIRANSVKIHGFKIESPNFVSGHYSSGLLIGASNIEIYSNIFSTAAYNDGNVAMSNAIQTWHKNNIPTVDISGLNIHDNTFNSLSTGNAGYEGIYLNLDTGTGSVIIQNNQFMGDIFRAITTERSNTIISGNTITTNLIPSGSSYTGTGSWQGVNIGGANNINSVTNVNVSSNTITGLTSGKGFSYGIKLGYDSINAFSNILIKNNQINNAGSAGIRILYNANGILVNNNNLSGNIALGIKNEDTSQVNAENNWWGTAVESEIAALVNGEVDYDPWWYGSTNPSDTTKPTVTFHNAPYFSGTKTITIDATITDDRDVERYILNFGDGINTTVDFTGNHDFSVDVLVDHTYSSNGDYVVSLTAYDATGNYVTQTRSVGIDSNSYDWRIPLTAGWNLISIPLIPTDSIGNVNTTLQEVLKSIAFAIPYESASTYEVMQYNAVTGTWNKARPYSSGVGFTGTLTSIVPGYAYWIKVNQDTVLKGTGVKTSPAPSGMPPSVQLGSGWNLIGKFGKESVRKDNETENLVFYAVDELKDLASYVIMSLTGTTLVDDSLLEPTKGYWALLGGNNGNSITYTVSETDYA